LNHQFGLVKHHVFRAKLAQEIPRGSVLKRAPGQLQPPAETAGPRRAGVPRKPRPQRVAGVNGGGSAGRHGWGWMGVDLRGLKVGNLWKPNKPIIFGGFLHVCTIADGSLLGLPHEWNLPCRNQPRQRKIHD